MTKGQCRTAISQNQQNIRQYNSQIAQLKNDIDELNRVKGKIVELQNTLADCKGASKAKLDSTAGLNNVSHKILSGIYDGMGNLLTGHPYTKVHNGLESAITTITNEIAKKQAQISDLNSNNMNSEISRIEADEAQKAQKAAAEKAKTNTKPKKKAKRKIRK